MGKEAGAMSAPRLISCDRCNCSFELEEEDIIFANSIGRDPYDTENIGWLCRGCTDREAELEELREAEEGGLW